jgi:glycosyltransferase involved in cell wall biosynthesis
MSEPLICLNMIVKNEAHVIKRCFDSVTPFIDTWVIVDTGSTDNTQQVIREYFARAGKPGALHERPWRDFGHNRSEALALARDKARYTLFIDADEVFEMPSGARIPELSEDAYQILHAHGTAGVTFWLTQLVRNALPWRWEGVLHEGLVCDAAHRTGRLSGPVTRGMFDSARNALPQEEKYRRDAEILEKALVTEPNNARYVFYLAQSWRDARQPEKALAAYRRRADMPGWEEEGWYAQYQMGRQLELLGRRVEALDAYLTAYQRRPHRAEPLYELARMHRDTKSFQVAHLFASAAKKLPRPDDSLFVDDNVYRWRALDEYAIACYWIEQFSECLRVSELLLTEDRLPEPQRERVMKNRDFALAKLK